MDDNSVSHDNTNETCEEDYDGESFLNPGSDDEFSTDDEIENDKDPFYDQIGNNENDEKEDDIIFTSNNINEMNLVGPLVVKRLQLRYQILTVAQEELICSLRTF